MIILNKVVMPFVLNQFKNLDIFILLSISIYAKPTVILKITKRSILIWSRNELKLVCDRDNGNISGNTNMISFFIRILISRSMACMSYALKLYIAKYK